MNKSRIAKFSSIVFITLFVGLCCLIPIADSLYSEIYHQVIVEPRYRERLGIGAKDSDVLAFIEQELLGLTHEEAINKLQLWGDVKVNDCTEYLHLDGSCQITLSHFLDTSYTYQFMVYYEDGKVEGISIEYS